MLVTAAIAALVVAVRFHPPRRSGWWRRPSVDEVGFAAVVAAELRAGRSLRQALEEAVSALPSAATLGRLIESGRPLTDTARRLASELPGSGDAVAAAIEMAGSSGGAVAPLFDRIAEQQAAAGQTEREQRVATAQIRLSATIVGVVPLSATIVLFATGRLGPVVSAGSFGVGVIAIGTALQLVGLGTIGALMRRGA